MDLAKVFNTVSHGTLLLIIRYDIAGGLFNWISDYLKGRYLAVSIIDFLSDLVSVNPQIR